MTGSRLCRLSCSDFKGFYDALAPAIGHATSEEELTDVEQDIDDIIKFELEKHVHRHTDAADIAALGLATHRLEHLIVQRRAAMRRI